MPGQKPSFQPGNPGKPKGAKARKTLIREAIGVKNWQDLTAWAEGQGLRKAIREMSKLKGKDYIYAYEALLEYVKPKLQRTTLVGDPTQPVAMADLSHLSFEQLKELAYGNR